MNTPDTERAIDVQRYHLGLAFKSILASENPEESFVEYISSRDTYWKERVRKEVGGLQERFGDWDNGDENEPLLLKCEVLGILDNLK